MSEPGGVKVSGSLHRLFTANNLESINEDAFLGLPHLEYLWVRVRLLKKIGSRLKRADRSSNAFTCKFASILQVYWKQPDQFDFTGCVPWTEDPSASVSSSCNDNFSWDSGTNGLWRTYAKLLVLYRQLLYTLEREMATTFPTVIYSLSPNFPLHHTRQNGWGYSFKNSPRSPHSHKKQCSRLQSPGWHCGARGSQNRYSATSKMLHQHFGTGRDQWRMPLSRVFFTGQPPYVVFSRSLAYNNLETLPKDLFKGLEALTKV